MLTEGDLLKLKRELDDRRRAYSSGITQPETFRGPTSRDETEIEVLFRAVAAICDHLAECEAKAL